MEDTVKESLVDAPIVYRGPTTWWLAVVILIGGAAIPVLNVSDSSWFSRAGCLVVMLGIWSGLGGLIRQKILNKRIAMRNRSAERRLRRKYRYDQATLDVELIQLEKRFAELTDKHHTKLQLSVGVQEATLLILGTFVWGFGDLIKLFLD